MTKRLFVAATLLLAAISGTEGAIANGAWSPSGCGANPRGSCYRSNALAMPVRLDTCAHCKR